LGTLALDPQRTHGRKGFMKRGRPPLVDVLVAKRTMANSMATVADRVKSTAQTASAKVVGDWFLIELAAIEATLRAIAAKLRSEQ
jgi:hypothetical protein